MSSVLDSSKDSYNCSAMAQCAYLCLQILNAVKDHMGLFTAVPFTEKQLQSVDGFHGGPDARSVEEEEALSTLRRHFAKPQADLAALLAMFRLDRFMSDLPPELP
jgi:hypothetical protein